MRRDDGRASADPARSVRGAHVFLGLGLAACAAVAAVDDPLRGWLLVALNLTAVGAGVVAVRRAGAHRSPARWLLLGTVVLVPAYVLWYPARLRWDLELGSPSITDWLFLSAYAAFIAALVRQVRRRSGADRRIHLLDSLIISVGVGVLVWVAFISPYLDDETMSLSSVVVAVSYTMVDLLLFGAVVRLLVQGEVASTGDRLLTGWVVAQLAADLVYSVTTLRGTFRLGGIAPTLYCVSFVLLGAALLHPSTMRIPHRPAVGSSPPGLRRIALLGSAALIAPAVLVALGLRGDSDDVAVVALLAAVLFGLVLLRMGLLMADLRESGRVEERLRASVVEERRRAEEHQELLASLRERQMLAERLSRIERKISSRAPLQDVLDAVTRGAAELLGDDVVGLRLLDEDDPGVMVLVSSVGVSAKLAAEVRRLPVGDGVGGRALVEGRLCTEELYDEWDGAIGAFAETGLRSAMGTPVHLERQPIGSLVVATHQAGRRYSPAERDALIALAEHVSLALNDARTRQVLHATLDRAVHQASHDDLTGLPNRARFYERTEQALRADRSDDASTAILLFDLDRFKEINDTLGHRHGDRVLQAIGPRLAPLLAGPEALARLGGDEFCVLLPGADAVTAAATAHRITEALEVPVEVDGMPMVVEASCGVAVAPGHGATADLLLQRADVAMYAAKTSQQRVVLYEPRHDRHTPDRLVLFGELRAAIASDQLVLHYQPQADLRTGAIDGVEALVRWQHPRLGLLGPEEFIATAEHTGLIRPLTSWVIDQALVQLRRWIDDPHFDVIDSFSVAVNLSTRSLDQSIGDEVRAALERVGVPAERLVLEITETTIMSDPARAQRVLARLTAAGVRFAIDDFGTGFSSLASLRNLPVDVLKIDKSFVGRVHEQADDTAIVRSVIDLGRTLGLRTIAEGVEHPEAWVQLADLGCDAAQGYLLAPPMTAAELSEWVSQRSAAQLDLTTDDATAVGGRR